MGRDRDGTEPVEYWDNLFFDTCDIGRGIADRRDGGDVIKGDREGWLGFGEGECDNTTAGGEVAGDEPEDMIVAITRKRGLRICWYFQCAYPGFDIQKNRGYFGYATMNAQPTEVE